MRVTGIIGSPRKRGNTDHLVRRILEGASERNAETEIVYLNDLNIRECQACMQCKENTFRCALDDDMQRLYLLIESSDIMVLGSPIYMGNITGLLKIFIDRWYAYIGVPEEERLPLGKRLFLVMPYAREEKDLFNHVPRQIGQAFKYVLGAKVDSWLVSDTKDAGDALQREDLMQQARQIGADLAEGKQRIRKSS